ncbi:hypothetical protein [Methanosphaera cuniculi]|uniref:Uncharacterized protein n=1 Tax=Methanosphaera cuniculi TaxID=1077256 RepID=A0A2A2HF69_9EURY|nr:hypothetical protein [Methanosphaera cuniculi]PAV08082.1 hypothetical protein ASJ82_01055 [Methanosphaera cuniculi]PWL08169.1 hypothetical protein MSCUN_11000 [Methanosphaera cuniculi]
MTSQKNNKNLYITNKNGKYCVYKNLNGKTHYYGAYKTLEEAKKTRTYIIMHQWKKPPVKENPDKHIYPYKKNKYRIIKQINGKAHDFGIYNTLEEARKERDLLIHSNWEYDYIDLL